MNRTQFSSDGSKQWLLFEMCYKIIALKLAKYLNNTLKILLINSEKIHAFARAYSQQNHNHNARSIIEKKCLICTFQFGTMSSIVEL